MTIRYESTSIHFLTPIVRPPSSNSIFDRATCKIANWADAFFSPFASGQYIATTLAFSPPRLGRQFSVIYQEASALVALTQTLSKVGLIAAAVLYSPSIFVPLLSIGLLIKIVTRSSENYYIGSSQPPLNPTNRPPGQQLTNEQRTENALKWMQKWMCRSYFTLFALGITEVDLTKLITPVNIYIGESKELYSGEFVAHFEFFQAMLRWNKAEPNTIRLTDDFQWTHAQLQALQESLVNATALTEDQYSLCDFLCRIFDKTPQSLVLEIQRALLSKNPLPDNPYFLGRPHLSDFSPGTKVGSHSFDFIPCPSQIKALEEIEEIAQRKTAVIDNLSAVSEMENEDHQCYFYNKIFNDFMDFLHHKVDSQGIDPWPLISEIIKKYPKCPQRVTILSIPSNFIVRQENIEVRLDEFLRSLPNLLWLQIDTFSIELNLDQWTYASDQLRVFSLHSQQLSKTQVDQIKIRFPNADVIEL